MDPRRGVQACVVDVYWRETVCGWCVGVGCGEGCVWGLPVCTECSAMPSSDSMRSAGPDTLRFSVSFTCTLKRIPVHRAVKHVNSDVTGIEIDTSEKEGSSNQIHDPNISPLTGHTAQLYLVYSVKQCGPPCQSETFLVLSGVVSCQSTLTSTTAQGQEETNKPPGDARSGQ